MRVRKLLLIPVVILPLCLFLAIARYRFVDPDEGFYLLASRLVFEHKLPYIDFFYTQAPLLPYVYGFWMYLIGDSFFAGRVLSACLTSALGILVYIQVYDHTKKRVMGFLAVLLFATNSLVFTWMPIAKTYALSSLLLFASYVVTSRLSSRSSRLAFLAAGLLFGLSIEVRVFFAAVLPVLLLYIFRSPGISAKKTAICGFLAGIAVAVLPSLYLFSLRADSYLFNNLGYHAIRSPGGLIGNVDQKLGAVLLAAILGPPGNGPQLGLLLVIYLFAIVKTGKATAALPFQMGATLAVISLLPTPAYLQYWCVVIPFVVVAAVCAGSNFIDSLPRRPSLTVGLAAAALLTIYVCAPIGEYRRFLIRGNGIGLPIEPAVNWKPDTIAGVSKAIDKLAVPGERVMSFWPGYMLTSKASEFPGMENDSGLACSALLSAAQQAKYHIASRPQIEAELAAHKVRIVVLGNQEYLNLHKQPYAAVLLRSGYHVAAVIGDTSIYTL